jgi:hypothetical protein
MEEDLGGWYDQVMEPNNSRWETVQAWLNCCKEAMRPELWASFEKTLRRRGNERVSAFTELVAMRIFESYVQDRQSLSGKAKGKKTPDWILNFESREIAVECTAKFDHDDVGQSDHREAKKLIEQWVNENFSDANTCTHTITKGFQLDRLRTQLARKENIREVRQQQASIHSREWPVAELRIECGAGEKGNAASCPIIVELDFSVKIDTSRPVMFLEVSCGWISDIVDAPIASILKKCRKYQNENFDFFLFINDHSGEYTGKFSDIIYGPTQTVINADQSFLEVRESGSSLLRHALPDNFLGIIFVSGWNPWHTANPRADVYMRSPELKALIEEVTGSELQSDPGFENSDLYICPDLLTCAGMWKDWPYPSDSTT